MVNEQEFRQVVEDDLVPMLQGTLATGSLPSTARHGLVSYVIPTRLAVKPVKNAGYRLAIDRSQPFSRRERELAGQFIKEVATVVALKAGDYQEELIKAIARRVVATHLGGGAQLRSVLEHLEEWSSQTYEGRRIVASIGLSTVPGGTGVGLADLWEKPFGPVLTNGYDTLLVVGSDGQVERFLQLSTPNMSSTAPYRLREVACWANGKLISVVLNQHGEILVFQNRSLRFARRSGKWLHYVHETNIRRMSPPSNRPLREAIYESCLDVSFARSGGCIGVIDPGQLGQLPTLVSPNDLLSGQLTYKTQFLSRTIGGVLFQALDRRARQELMSLDGATILDRYGRILSLGAIIDVPPGSVGGGGRTAAAIRLSRVGLGLKVSQDGTITGFRGGNKILKT